MNYEMQPIYETELSALVSVLPKKNESLSYIVPTCYQIHIEEDYENNEAKILFNRLDLDFDGHKVGDKWVAFSYCITDDPTPNGAYPSVVSLGYYSFRVHVENVTVINLNPLQIVCSMGKNGIKTKTTRPLRGVPNEAV